VSSHPEPDTRHWRAYPARAFLVRATVFAIPVLVSVLIGTAVSNLLPTPNTTLGLVLWWAAVLVPSTLGMYAADRFARRLVPLATLLRLSMLFPDQAPSRLKVARRVSGSRAIAAELERAHHLGVTGNRQEAAETILALVGALGDYDSRTRGHSERTQLFVTMLADELHLKEEDRGRLMWTALVHDIGKLKVPHEVLNKPGKPTDEEWHILHSHPVQGANICEPLREWLGEWWYAIEQHHEQFDGTGYPRGLAGKEISYGARIVAVADSYEVMTAARPYKRPMSAEAARQELIRCAGTQFDPDVVRAFLNISIGNINRWSGPLAWLAQFVMIRPGPVLGQVFGTAAGAAAATAGVVGLSLAPVVAHSSTASAHRDGVATHASEDPRTGGPAVTEPTTSAATEPSGPPSTSPSTTPATSSSSGGPSGHPSSPPTTAPGTTSPTGPSPTSTTPGRLTLIPDRISAVEDQAKSVDVIANDLAPSGGTIQLTSVVGAAHGSVEVVDDDTVRYTPTSDFHGSDSFRYEARDEQGNAAYADVDVAVAGVNDDPKPVRDDVRLTEDSGAITLDLTGNDTDADGDQVRLVSVSQADHGSVSLLPSGAYTYSPDQDFHGSEQLDYTVTDGHGGRSSGIADVTVTPVNDAPVTGPTAYATSVAVRLRVDKAHGVLSTASDVDGDDLRVVSDDSALVDIDTDGSISYLPLVPGSVTVRYVVSDGTDRTTGTTRITVTLLAGGARTLYLQPPDGNDVGDLTTSPPTGGVSDWDDDGKPGLTPLDSAHPSDISFTT
jgi:putative nucleotidyltransferase with HDIG domain